MLKNKWIISDKEEIPKTSGFLYTLILVDGETDIYKTEIQHVCSDTDLHIGDFVGHDLNPLTKQYRAEYSDIATVEFTKIYNGNNKLKKVLFFDEKYGSFEVILETDYQKISMKRGDEISVFIVNNPSSPLNIEKTPDFLQFKILQNLVSGQKIENYEYFFENYSGTLKTMIVVGIDNVGTGETPAMKTMLINSPKFGYILSSVSPNETLFHTRAKDKLLIERDHQTGNIEILRNITIDNIRTAYVLNQR